MSNRIKFRMIAFTGAAGKSDPTAPMGGNEDNFYVDDNLSDNIPSHFEVDKVIDMAEYGLIMAVADGMGGQNAGEVASGIAVKTVQDFFAPGALTPQIVKTPETRRKYLEQLVIEADKRIKDDAKTNSDHEGMGSTIILAWVVGNQLTLTWCGDSRAYRFNPNLKEIERLSRDHSYVEELVKQGVITYDDTFEHPQGNIVTRSLGERGTKAQPETRQFEIFKNDIILLCSDGLSGVLRDKKTKDHNGNYYPGENIEDIIRDNNSTMKQCKDALWNAAERADWYDNVTIILCQILDGVKELDNKEIQLQERRPQEEGKQKKVFFNKTITNIRVTPKSILYFLLLVGVLIIGIFSIRFVHRTFETNENTQLADSLYSNENRDKAQDEYTRQKDELLNFLQTGCHDYIVATDLKDIDNSCFDDIKGKIAAIKDTASLSETDNNVKDFVKKAQTRARYISRINDEIKQRKGNSAIINKLKTLRNRCIDFNQNISEDDFNKELGNILPKRNDNQVGDENGSGEESGPTDDDAGSGYSIKMTPIDINKDEEWEQIVMPKYEVFKNNLLPELKKKWKNKGYNFDGVYTKNKEKNVGDKFDPDTTYQLKFVRIRVQ